MGGSPNPAEGAAEPGWSTSSTFANGCKYWRNKNGALSGIKAPNKMYCSLLALEWGSLSGHKYWFHYQNRTALFAPTFRSSFVGQPQMSSNEPRQWYIDPVIVIAESFTPSFCTFFSSASPLALSAAIVLLFYGYGICCCLGSHSNCNNRYAWTGYMLSQPAKVAPG